MSNYYFMWSQWPLLDPSVSYHLQKWGQYPAKKGHNSLRIDMVMILRNYIYYETFIIPFIFIISLNLTIPLCKRTTAKSGHTGSFFFYHLFLNKSCVRCILYVPHIWLLHKEYLTKTQFIVEYQCNQALNLWIF